MIIIICLFDLIWLFFFFFFLAISQQTEDALVSVLIPVEEQFKALVIQI